MTTATVVLVNATGIRSGAENVLVDVARHLHASGRDIVLVSPPGPLVDAFPACARHVAIPTLGLEGRGGVGRLVGIGRVVARWIRAGRILRSVTKEHDVVVVNSLFALPALPAAFPRPRRTGVTTWLVHDTVVSRKQQVAVAVGAARLRRAVAVSEVTAASIRPQIPDVVVRPNGVRIPRDIVATTDRAPVVGILAALTPWKGQDMLLEAIALCPGVTVEIAGGALPGEEEYAQALRERAERADLRGRVTFLGYVDRAEVLGRWAIAVSASVLPEAGPLGVLECMAAGLPVIATDHGGAAEYLADGAGVLVPPGDPLALARTVSDLLVDTQRRRGIAETARKRVTRRYDLERTLPAMVAALTAG